MTAQGSTDMLRRLAALAASTALLGAVPTGSLFVTTLPAGVDVWLDGVYGGRTPVVLDGLPAGRHALGLTRAGWRARELDVTVESGRTSLSTVRLERAGSLAEPGGTIAIRGAAPIAIRLDGAPAAAGPDGTIAAATGTHRLVLETAAGRITREVDVWPSMRTDVLILPPGRTSRPSVVAPAADYLPASAVRIDGEDVAIRYGGREVSARIGDREYRVDGRSVTYDSAPARIGPRLYLPIDLLTLLTKNRTR